jgi:FkbM family methyltransferase
MKNFIFKKKSLEFIKDSVKLLLFKKLTKSAMPLFVKGGDISASTMSTGYHEDYLVQFIKSNADEKSLNDFFIDIGANIGLTSCQVGNHFKEVHMYEPNPLLVKILDVNTQLMLEGNSKLYPFGLGLEEGFFSLTVPKNNWGGAFINDSNNTYDPDLLAAKDGYLEYDSTNYLSIDIKVNNTITEMALLFSDLKEKGFHRGCIKIDVEGYEDLILSGITQTIPSDFEVMIICESWGSENYDCLLQKPFSERSSIGNLFVRRGWIADWSWLKAIQIILRGSYDYIYESDSSINTLGDVVIHVKPAGDLN